MYEILSSFAQTWGLLLFVMLFLGALAYALWPKNQDRFDKAAHAPLNESDTPLDAAQGD
ncbi:cbb3-type cytochrome c oxidase subunit 3 [Maricaulis sp.]|uniref:cbb3-type cytochrome c oxidase subunit 3 n=1 Tax=Maricaulis sp. TaxID=1486257 RepID=UPI0026042399|nr:cbb3-type cytochrome c oxidase subunit 3 [Maricaulis sp.]